MTKIGLWMRKHLDLKSSARKRSTDELPFLPLSRRPITPNPVDTPTCRFFQLPYHIRSMILFMAFGDRTLHVDLVRQENVWKWGTAVCCRNLGAESGVSPGGSVPSTRSAVSTRLSPNGHNTATLMRHVWIGLWIDRCMDSVYRRGGRYLKQDNTGIMGFLLSCRHAYTEGIDVLYSTNCISIQSVPLLLHLPQLLPLNRLASITALEIMVWAHRIEHADGTSLFSMDHLKPILNNIATQCHHLRGLCLSFAVDSSGCEILDGSTLPLVDVFYRSKPLRRMRVELPSQDYRLAWNPLIMDAHPNEARADAPLERSPWRSLDGEKPTIQNRSIERYPYPPLRLPVVHGDETKEDEGYWLCEGDRGPAPPMICMGL
jgi:hypothetical protein